MKTFTLSIDIQDNSIRDSVYIAQMLREAAATVEYPTPLMSTRRAYGANGAKKFEWAVTGTLLEKKQENGGRGGR